MRVLHSADWQIGARFRQFGEKAPLLREARLRTLGRVLQIAEERQVDALLIAGDLFEDHHIEAATVARVYELLETHSAIPIFILPGNHDPIGGSSAIWARRPFAQPLDHVKIFAQAEAVELAGGWLVANPLQQKQSSTDPSQKLADLARGLPADAVKIGLTHGSFAIPGNHKPDDFPITVDAATRAGLDFLAVGHWHSALTIDGGRLHMPGTPEPTAFNERGSGSVYEVEITAPGALPQLTPLACGELAWRHFAWELGTPEETRARMEQDLATCTARPSQTIAHFNLQGLAAPVRVAEVTKWLQERTAGFAVCEIRDETQPDFTEVELADLQREHPLLTQVLGDLQSLLCAAPNTEPAFTRAELDALEKSLGAQPGEIDASLVAAARRLLMRELREVQTAC